VKISAYRTTMPFDNRTDGGPALSPTTDKSIMPSNNVHTIQDVLDGRKYDSLHGGGDWSPGEDVEKSYREKGDDYKRREIDLDRWKRDKDIANKLIGFRGESQKWEIKSEFGNKTFDSFYLAQLYLRDHKIPYTSLSRIAQNNMPENNSKEKVIADSMSRCFMVESMDLNKSTMGVGSSFCVYKNYFITCAHVIRKYNKYGHYDLNYFLEGSNISLIRNGQKIKVEIIDVDPIIDIALLRADINVEPFQLDTISIIGEDIIAIGSPHGYENNVSTGTIGSLNRKIYFYKNAPGYMFVDLSIFPGSSGGPIIKVSNGRVTGMITLIVSGQGEYGLNAALSGNYIEEFCKRYIKGF
jgi:S1-C subfamily serine protease